MIVIEAENYSVDSIPKDCLHSHFDGTHYFFAENADDVKVIIEIIKKIDSNFNQ